LNPPLLLAWSLLVITCSSWATTPLQTDIEQLQKTSTFALGQVGFIGHISDSEQRYRRILQSPDALATFKRILAHDESSTEARLYAACAIRALAPEDFERLTKALSLSGKKVSVLRTDILDREPVKVQLANIASNGCNEAHWK